MAWYHVGVSRAQRDLSGVRKLSDGFVVRAVFGLPALREKLVCFDHGIDDRLLAVLVLDLLRGGELLVHPGARPLLVDANEDALVFVAGRPSGQAAPELGMSARWVDDVRFSVPRSRLARIEQERIQPGSFEAGSPDDAGEGASRTLRQ